MTARISKFAVIGLMSTGLYAMVAYWLSMAGSAVQASIVAYGIAAVFSYYGHKFVTFASDGAHGVEGPRFVTLTIAGLFISWSLPFALSGRLGLSPLVPIVATCVLIPAFNYVILGKWVFRDAR